MPRRNAAPPIAPSVTLRTPGSRDQDDMCLWVHPTKPTGSTVITSDKSAGRLFVYGLGGEAIQSVEAPHPGNIDLRYGFPLGGKKVDIVAFNERREDEIWVFGVDPATRRLRRIDNGRIRTKSNYGGTMYRSAKTGKFYFVTTSRSCQQYELFDDGAGKVAGKLVRSWKTGYSEGACGDDEAGTVYVGEEGKGVWAVGGEPSDPTPGKLVIRVGENGLVSDVEGVAIYHTPGGKGYLLVSSQGNNSFKVYRRRGAHEYLGTFAIQGARDTDGIDVTNVALGAAFPKGLFACHTDSSGRPVLLTRWEHIAKALAPPLKVDTTWAPRRGK
jgi:3-phytase